MKHLLAAAFIFSTPLAFSCTQVPQPTYDPSSYYASAEGLTGTALKTELNLIIHNHTVYSYTPCVWDILAIADADPTDSSKVIAFYTQRPILISNRDQGAIPRMLGIGNTSGQKAMVSRIKMTTAIPMFMPCGQRTNR